MITNLIKMELVSKSDVLSIKFTNILPHLVNMFRDLNLPPKTNSFTTNPPPQQKSSIINQKTFVTYENQRWWLGRNWCDQMLPRG